MSAFLSTSVLPAALAGVVATFCAWLAFSRLARRERELAAHQTRSLGERLNAEQIAVAGLRAEAAAREQTLAEVRAGAARHEAALAGACGERNDFERRLAVEQARVASLRACEEDVEARFERVALRYVEEARDVLVKTAAERLSGDSDALRDRMSATVAPLRERLEQLGSSLATLGTERAKDQERVSTLLEALNGKMSGLDDATRRVERVLGNSQARGSWGEFELQRLLELSGMTEHVSFDVQAHGYGDDGCGRPDVVLRIPGDLSVPIDAKCPFSSYQQAVSAGTDDEREPLLSAAVAAIRAHVKVLEARRYHAADRCIGWTIMFVPIEAMLSTLFARDPNIFEAARDARILIASPLTLLLYLEAFSRGWAAQKQSENAETILYEAHRLVERLTHFTDKYAGVGKRLESALEAYNESVGSYESRVGPQARRILELRGERAEPRSLEEKRTNVRHLDKNRIPSPPPLLEPVPHLMLESIDPRPAGPSHEREAG